jgi:hypothetical protein
MELGDCMYRNETHGPHTAVSIEGACIRGLRLDPLADSLVPADVCGECLYFAERRHAAKERK